MNEEELVLSNFCYIEKLIAENVDRSKPPKNQAAMILLTIGVFHSRLLSSSACAYVCPSLYSG
jgi:hypothetical protein